MGMEIKHNNKWVCMKRVNDNYFNIDGLGEIKFPKKFRVTSISGEQLEATLPGIKNDENIPTDIQYSGFKPGMLTLKNKELSHGKEKRFNPWYSMTSGEPKLSYWDGFVKKWK